MDQQCRHGLPGHLTRIQDVHSDTVPTSVRYQPDIPVHYLVNDVLRLRISHGQPLDSDFWVLAPLEILGSWHPRSLHRLHESRSRIRIHEHHFRPSHIHPANAACLAAQAFEERKSWCLRHLHEWSNVCRPNTYFSHPTLNTSDHRTCVVAAVRYVYIVQENSADAKYFIWRFILPPGSYLQLIDWLTNTSSIMEINIGVMCSCMPAFRPFFARVLPRLSVDSLTGRPWRSKNHRRFSERPEEGEVMEMGRYRSIVGDTPVDAEQPRAIELPVEGISSHVTATKAGDPSRI